MPDVYSGINCAHMERLKKPMANEAISRPIATQGSQSQMGTESTQWHTLEAHQVADWLNVKVGIGLSTDEAHQRLIQFGLNRLHEEKHETLWQAFLEEVREPLILLLLVTAVLYGIWGELSDTVTICAVILIVVGAEIFNERRAAQAVSALRKLAEPTASVRRDGHYLNLPTEEIAAGDVILIQAGRRVPADARLLEIAGMAADESALTGESVPVDKEAEVTLPSMTPLAERRNLIFAGSTISRGQGTALVVATGMNTELGRVAGLAREAKAPRTPLQLSMRALSRSMVWVALGFSLAIPLLGWLRGQPVQQMLLTGLSLAFATIPEELPIIITLVLALGAYRLSRRHAIVKRLGAVETLGAVTVIATDKTGTLTENRMEVGQFNPVNQTARLLEMGILCNHATLSGADFVGDPLEISLLRAAQKAGLNIEKVRQFHPLQADFPFDSVRKRMSVAYADGDQLNVIVKGAPEAILPLTDADPGALSEQAEKMAAAGQHVLAFAEKTVPRERLTQETAESGLAFIGFIGLADPPRADANAAIAAARSAGIRPIMITGDHPLTALAIARQVGLEADGPIITGTTLDLLSDEALRETVKQATLFARATPEHKLRIVRALQANGERVAVTGDGVNDAPALAAADIGIAMGQTGTDVAREAAAMVLADDNYATIVHAVEEGRILFENLKKGVRYYLACKVALVSISLLAVLMGVPVPFAPVQIILMELFMDLAASATFVAEPPEADLMRLPPRDSKISFMNRSLVTSIFIAAAGLFVAVSAVYLITWSSGAGQVQAQTVAFITWLIGHVLLAFNLRSEREPLLRLGIFSNRLMIIWAVATVLFVLIISVVPGVQALVKTSSLSRNEWVLIVGSTLIGTFWLEARKWLTYRLHLSQE